MPLTFVWQLRLRLNNAFKRYSHNPNLSDLRFHPSSKRGCSPQYCGRPDTLGAQSWPPSGPAAPQPDFVFLRWCYIGLLIIFRLLRKGGVKNVNRSQATRSSKVEGKPIPKSLSTTNPKSRQPTWSGFENHRCEATAPFSRHSTAGHKNTGHLHP